ncbi:MAG: hypothetical protein IT249_08800 [Chitinophagaceae bacterium]|nr:hypothetical protein [Chitinophagaceae bacterium]
MAVTKNPVVHVNYTKFYKVFMQQWGLVRTFGSGLYYGIAGLQHVLIKSAGINEMFALVTNISIFLLLLAYFVTTI